MNIKNHLFIKSINNNIYIDKYFNSLMSATEDKWRFIVSPLKLSSYKKRYGLLFDIFYLFFIIFLPALVFFKISVDFFKVLKRKIYKRDFKSDFNTRKFQNIIILSDYHVLNLIDKQQLSDYCLITLPLYKEKLDDRFLPLTQSSILSISIKSLFVNYFISLKAIFEVAINYGYKNILYASHALEWFILYDALNSPQFNKDQTIYFSNQKDRWAILYDNIDFKNKVLVQHGTNIIKVLNSKLLEYFKYVEEYNSYALIVPVRYNTINRLVAFTEEEAKHLFIGEFNTLPTEINYSGYYLTISNWPIKTNKTLILLIGNINSFYNQEKFIVENLDERKFELLVKPHPLSSKKEFEAVYNQCTVVDINPKVDIVISYNSTLAYEYMSLGFKVMIYDTIENAQQIVYNLNKGYVTVK